MSSDVPILITGEILFSAELGSFSGATVNVYLEDASFLDAPAKIVAKQVISHVAHEMGTENRVKFAFIGEIADIHARYSLRVHTALHGNEQIQRGDYISMESYPVLTFGYPHQVTICVKEVK
ncbi:hypothetical protein C7B80_16680 [Cyanosarcina cf. burmensis CCALA 770]|nr:hypothetical protein C7B80_16680 [Cyanosarcina cf. burmensis CCALA 770]